MYYICLGSFISSGSLCKLWAAILGKLPDPYKLPTLLFLNIQLYENEAEDKKPCIVSNIQPPPTLVFTPPCSFPPLHWHQATEKPSLWKLIGCECLVVLCLHQDVCVCAHVCTRVRILIWRICITLFLLFAKISLREHRQYKNKNVLG